jgi:hypothetical protein
MPQYFKQNNAIIELGMKYMTPESVKQYQIEERSLIANRMHADRLRLKDVISVMKTSVIFLPENLKLLKKDLDIYYKDPSFKTCENMGDVLEKSLRHVVRETA